VFTYPGTTREILLPKFEKNHLKEGAKNMKKNIAVIGCGYWGKNLVRNFYELNALHAICDSDESKLSSFKEKYPDLLFYSNYRDLFKEPIVQAVVISTPAATHYALAKEALLSNKDIFVEKPIALNYKEGAELVALAKSRKKLLMVGHILEYHPAVTKLKELIDKGELGKIHYIYSNRLNLGKFRTEENILWSFAPHDISIILYLLGEMPHEVSAHGGNYLNPNITDVTVTTLDFASGTKAHIFVSWLHPYKEQKLIVIGDKKMVLFDDVSPKDKLIAYNHKIDWIERLPVPHPEDAKPIEIEKKEPLKSECEHFIECLTSRETPKTDGASGLKVLQILEACQESLRENGKIFHLAPAEPKRYFVHKSAFIDDNVQIGDGTKIWHFSHILSGAHIGRNCILGQNVNVGNNVTIGNYVKIQNNVSIYEGVTLEDYVFCGPAMVFTNIIDPRSKYPQVGSKYYKKTLVKEGASLGANSTILCGHTIGRYAFIGAGAVVTEDVPDFALVVGNPARIVGWMSEAGKKLIFEKDGYAFCEKSLKKYKLENGTVREIEDTKKNI
jgi:UDP-2-acetamido-3-amino-2,3-dideoxy-glucuronate N-acetyltransferase